MAAIFHAESVARSKSCADGRRLEVCLTDAAGKRQVLNLNAVAAESLARVLEEFASKSPARGPMATKLPQSFAVGSGRYEPLVLLRFEDETPYGLEAEQAAALARALVEQSEIVCTQPAVMTQ